MAGGFVSSAADVTGNGWDVTQATAGRQPVLGAINGHNALLFDGIDDEMRSTFSGTITGQPLTTVTVWRYLGAAALAWMYVGGTQGASLYMSADGLFRFESGSPAYVTGVALNDIHVSIGVAATAPAGAFWIDGAPSSDNSEANGAAGLGQFGTLGWNGIRLGHSKFNAHWSNVLIGDHLVFNADLSAKECSITQWARDLYAF